MNNNNYTVTRGREGLERNELAKGIPSGFFQSDITSDLTKDDWQQGQDEQQATVSPPTDKTNNKIENKENILLT